MIAPWAAPLLAPAAPGGAQTASAAQMDQSANVFVFDFGAPSESDDRSVLAMDSADLDRAFDWLMRESFTEIVDVDRAAIREGREPRRFICVNAVHNLYESLIRGAITVETMPFASRLRQGFALPDPIEDAWRQSTTVELLERVEVGPSGRRTHRGIEALFGRRGYLFSASVNLPPGDYEAEVSFEPRTPLTATAMLRPAVVEVVVGARRLGLKRVRSLFGTTVSLPFTVTRDSYARGDHPLLRLLRGRSVPFIVTRLALRRVRALSPFREVSEDHRRMFGLLEKGTFPRGVPHGVPDAPARNTIASGTA